LIDQIVPFLGYATNQRPQFHACLSHTSM